MTLVSGGLRTTALVVLGAGLLAAEALMLYAGRTNTHLAITALFVAWVMAPFVLLYALDAAAARLPFLASPLLYWLMIAIAVTTVGLFVRRVMTPPAAQPAYIFVMTAPASCAVIAAAASALWIAARRRLP